MKKSLLTVGSALLIPAILAGSLLFFVATCSVHAHASSSPSCALTGGTIAATCDGQDPVAQGCATSATNASVQPAFTGDTLIGEVDLRYSNTCKSYWVRTIAYANTQGLVSNVEANTTYASASVVPENHDNTVRSADGSLSSYTNMTYQQVPQHASGVFDFSDTTPSITISLN